MSHITIGIEKTPGSSPGLVNRGNTSILPIRNKRIRAARNEVGGSRNFGEDKFVTGRFTVEKNSIFVGLRFGIVARLARSIITIANSGKMISGNLGLGSIRGNISTAIFADNRGNLPTIFEIVPF